MAEHVTIDLNEDELERARAAAENLGMSTEDYLRSLIAERLPAPKGQRPISALFGLIDDGEPTDVARDKDKMIGEAVWTEYRFETGKK